MSAAIAFERVSKRFGDTLAIEDASLAVEPGEFVSLLGPSGSGKSTLLNLAVGALLPDSGRLTIQGRDASRLATHQRDIGMVFQRYALFPHKTLRENIAYPLAIRRQPAAEVRRRVDALLQMTGLQAQAERYPAEISGGQAQRVALARALAFEPALLLMDEPLGALDKNLRLELQAEIHHLQRRTGVPTLYVTHDQEEALYLSHRIALCNLGRIVALGTPEALYREPPNRWAAQFLGDANVLPVSAWRDLGDGTVAADSSGGAVLRARNPHGLRNGSRAVLILRPEDCRLYSQPQAAGTSLPVRLEHRHFLGARQRLELRLADGQALQASLSGSLPAPAADSPLHLGWSELAPLLVEDL
ncbi:ABC transporter ATP-binding protein [Stutzerimonas kirkiae]|uniref:ABC transporter ATP-binding protein n=1 Tax=Stutzerimonas kirkiae TaxID=2211392 RepID=UPI0013F167DF|nr:ABC transporter ATP-binding protein [Stutzerimonas kirkiae]